MGIDGTQTRNADRPTPRTSIGATPCQTDVIDDDDNVLMAINAEDALKILLKSQDDEGK